MGCLVRPLQLRFLFAQLLQLVTFGGGQPVVPVACIGLGLADPAAQGLSYV
jgi:hypothetical protein